MGRPRQLLEAERARLYEEMPVPEKWHDAYALGQMVPDNYIDDCCQRGVRFEPHFQPFRNAIITTILARETRYCS
jgi:hypothetical protein